MEWEEVWRAQLQSTGCSSLPDAVNWRSLWSGVTPDNMSKLLCDLGIKYSHILVLREFQVQANLQCNSKNYCAMYPQL